ncbi:MAG: DNA primase [Candidatus Nitrosocaldaceae archaeon]|nr:MAG: DNA primase [Candidatus Nitrosocaldaceae archaeon]
MPNSTVVKYHVKIKFDVDGIVEKADIIGALFGQTEGLLGPEMNLNELQRLSKVGRIEVDIHTKQNRTFGKVLIPMSTDISTAALIAAAVESIDKVGPFPAKFSLDAIEDIREIKKRSIVERAKKIVQEWATKSMSESKEMLKDIYGAARVGKLTVFGPEKLACGSGIYDTDWIILVEGRADVINLLRAGYDNAIAIEGARIADSVIKLCKDKKKVIAFLDGDRAGDLILRELENTVKLDKVVRAPQGKEVEDLTPMEIIEILDEAVKSIQEKKVEITDEFDKRVVEVFPEINETLEAVGYDENMNEVLRVPVNEIVKRLQDTKDVRYLILDGIITQRLVDTARDVGVKYIIAHRIADIKKPSDITLKTFGDLGIT